MSYQTGINSTNTSITHDAHNDDHRGNDSDDNDTFIINLRGVKIPITRTQIESDSPGDNLFASSLLGDFIESSSKTIKLDRNPGLFRIILDHLSGYTVLPLDLKLLKEYGLIGMSVERAIRYLLDDTEYYGFARFNALLNEELLRLQENKESYEEEMLSIKKQRLKIEMTRLKLDIKKANEATESNLNDRRLQLLQMNLDVELRRLQYQSIYAASRQTGANEYATYQRLTERHIDRLCNRLGHFTGSDVLDNHELEDTARYEEFTAPSWLNSNSDGISGSNDEASTSAAGPAGAVLEERDGEANSSMPE